MTAEEPLSEGASEFGIRVTRVFDAPRERVWKEWTEPARFADWFGGPDSDVPLSSVSMDVQPGGSWRLTMFSKPGPRESRWNGEYREVAAPERLVFTITDQPGEEIYDLVIVVLKAIGDDRTEMVFEQRGGTMSAEQYGRAKEGWGLFFDRIAQRLAAM
jgi:uncharacterized protein YndB with AHSA1/START domain